MRWKSWTGFSYAAWSGQGFLSNYLSIFSTVIVKKLNRACTVAPGYGGGVYSGKRVMRIMSMLSRREAMQLRLFVCKLDLNSFMTIMNSSENIGKGFRRLN